ncbi:MAG: DUF1192 domain-containing protein [Alphaproteobacteria bacterium]|jgi:uncharacterized small protein (DUF1192 family)|nr:DUF1192 domain-containing protein [Alphaproteobacteria bacterium]MDP7223000.1 DUF1192 domain-containing protein [Alphaproteobacteria bacterium]
MFEDDDALTSKKSAPRVLDDMSVDELETYIDNLKAEIARVEAEIEKKEASKNAADAFFKS